MMRESEKSTIKVWVDGCFDGLHYGHLNALRQAKEMGDYLIVGIHSDKDILLRKGKTVFGEDERYEAVLACKWVDEICRGSDYTTQLEDLEKYECDFCVHGDDITTTEDGKDCYSIVKKAGKYKECKRTEGISTTDLVRRMLMRKEHPQGFKPRSDQELVSRLYDLFHEPKSPKRGDKVVYVQGSWDMFHIGHIKFLEKAKTLGDFLVVGIEGDDQVFKNTGKYPILDSSERRLAVLACRHVDNSILLCNKQKEKELLFEFESDLIVYTIDDYKLTLKDDCDGTLGDLGSERIINMILDNYEM
jgi:ethanolamine-phosphate cytidylyltransferase